VLQVLAAMNASTLAYARKTDDTSGLELCFGGFPQGQLPSVPGMTFHFQGGDMVLPPSNYFIFLESSQSYCFSMVGLATHTPTGKILLVLGKVPQQGEHGKAHCTWFTLPCTVFSSV